MWPLIFEGCLASRSLTPNWTENESLSANCAKVNRDVFRALAPVSWSRKAAWQPHSPPQNWTPDTIIIHLKKKKKCHFPLPLYWQPQIVQKNVGNKISVMKKNPVTTKTKREKANQKLLTVQNTTAQSNLKYPVPAL